MNYSKLQSEVIREFSFGQRELNNSRDISIEYYLFISKNQYSNNYIKDNGSILTDNIRENIQFYYPVIKPKNDKKFDKAILLLHGLNERNWQKYINWAIYLCENLRRPVILFPMAYHINRSPESWSNPRALAKIYEIRKKEYGNDRSISFANLAISDRLSKEPERFYNSGRQSLYDIYKLMSTIKSGNHELFIENTEVNVLSYSIGAFLAEIAFMADTENYFSNSKLFMFCGGGIFSSMDGESRQIMDKYSFESICNFYKNIFEHSQNKSADPVRTAFLSLISNDKFESFRKHFFELNNERINGLFLMKDKVMPYFGVELAMDKKVANKCIKLEDFEYQYTHENPFPLYESNISEKVDSAFEKTFNAISVFLD